MAEIKGLIVSFFFSIYSGILGNHYPYFSVLNTIETWEKHVWQIARNIAARNMADSKKSKENNGRE
jgi:hypothetical protein